MITSQYPISRPHPHRTGHAMRCRVGDALTTAGQWVVTILGFTAALFIIVGSVLLLVFAGLNLLGVVTK